MSISRLIDEVRQDLRFALRTLRQNRTFALIVILTVAIGIGATTAIYSIVDAILLRPLPFADSDALVRVIENVPLREPGRAYQRGITYQMLVEWRAQAKTLTDIAAVGTSIGLVKTADGTARLWGTTVSESAFSMLGARAMLGRTLGPADAADPNVVVLGFDTWRRRFHSDPAVVGRTVEFLSGQGAGRLMTIVGVLPAAFVFPIGEADFFVPLAASAASQPNARFTMIGRLAPGVALASSEHEANLIGEAIGPPPAVGAAAMTVPRFQVQRFKDRAVGEVRPALRLFLGSVAAVLLIVCANVANLLLARGTARQREMAVRFAIGATRWRVVRQVLTECVVLAGIGGVLGALVAAAGVTLVKDLASIEAPGVFRLSLGASILPRLDEVDVDVRLLATAFGLAGLASLMFGVLPALHLSRPNQFHGMGPRGGGSSRAASRLRGVLVVGQLVMATVLLVGAGLLVHSFGNLLAVDRGYDPSRVLAFQLVFPPDYAVARKTEAIEQILGRVRALPNVVAAGFTRAGMLIGEQITLGTFVPEGRTLEDMQATSPRPSLRPVSPGYLTAMGVPVLEGRELEPTDAAAAVPAIVISRSVARQFFSGGLRPAGPPDTFTRSVRARDPRQFDAGSSVGRVIDWHMGKLPPVPLQVVGVVEDLRNTAPDRQPYPEVFVDYRDLLALQQRWGETSARQHESALGLLSFAVKTRDDPAASIRIVSDIVHATDRNAGIDAILPIEQLVSSSVARPRFNAAMLAGFAAVAAILAAIGVYGVLAYAVTQRTQEIGIRLALGAQRAQILSLVLRHGALLTIAGVTLGLVGAVALTRFLEGMLFGVTPLDLPTFVAVSLMFGLVTMLASYGPARRATKVDPMVALRTD